jgi:signal transduction histidine kinase
MLVASSGVRLLRFVWAEPRPAAPVRVWRDWVLVAALVAAGVLEGVLRPDVPLRVLSAVVTVGLIPTLLWRRNRPLLMLVIVFVVLGVLSRLTSGAIPEVYTAAYVLILPYASVRWGSGREVVIGVVVVLLKGALTTSPGQSYPADVIAGGAVLLSTMALGAGIRFWAGARTRALEQVKVRERERLARDLHDTVAHHVSAITIRAQAGIATAATRPEAAVDALRVIEAEASRTLAEMRGMVHLLRRNEAAELAPSPQLGDLPQLAGRDRAGPPVDLEVSGDIADLPPSLGATIYRLVQESVTNARRHARHATRIEVRVAVDDASVRLRVSDDGETGLLRPIGSPGYGLIGMIERAHLLGGSCEAGPAPQGGWTVTAVLPRTGAPA